MFRIGMVAAIFQKHNQAMLERRNIGIPCSVVIVAAHDLLLIPNLALYGSRFLCVGKIDLNTISDFFFFFLSVDITNVNQISITNPNLTQSQEIEPTQTKIILKTYLTPNKKLIN